MDVNSEQWTLNNNNRKYGWVQCALVLENSSGLEITFVFTTLLSIFSIYLGVLRAFIVYMNGFITLTTTNCLAETPKNFVFNSKFCVTCVTVPLWCRFTSVSVLLLLLLIFLHLFAIASGGGAIIMNKNIKRTIINCRMSAVNTIKTPSYHVCILVAVAVAVAISVFTFIFHVRCTLSWKWIFPHNSQCSGFGRICIYSSNVMKM